MVIVNSVSGECLVSRMEVSTQTGPNLRWSRTSSHRVQAVKVKPPPGSTSLCGPSAPLLNYMTEITAGCWHQNGFPGAAGSRWKAGHWFPGGSVSVLHLWRKDSQDVRPSRQLTTSSASAWTSSASGPTAEEHLYRYTKLQINYRYTRKISNYGQTTTQHTPNYR